MHFKKWSVFLAHPVYICVWFVLSTEVCAAISTAAFLIVPQIHVSQIQSPQIFTEKSSVLC